MMPFAVCKDRFSFGIDDKRFLRLDGSIMINYEITKLHKDQNEIGVETAIVYNYHTHMHSYYEMTLYCKFDGIITINDKEFKIKSIIATLIIPSDFHKIKVSNANNAQYILKYPLAKKYSNLKST